MSKIDYYAVLPDGPIKSWFVFLKVYKQTHCYIESRKLLRADRFKTWIFECTNHCILRQYFFYFFMWKCTNASSQIISINVPSHEKRSFNFLNRLRKRRGRCLIQCCFYKIKAIFTVLFGCLGLNCWRIHFARST